ncbi:hypothetical protein [uncultured Desulfobacter sp.]|uniref:hypothetical protein n=1 Tax=uncultured Desulfobacter sp. TaxID=240139 RepID=UPI002AAB64E0|nr:hypothetical protein [uncultured Desulfobacter sp.]
MDCFRPRIGIGHWWTTPGPVLVSTLQGSTETTFYVMAVYFGAVGVRQVRHTLATVLTADLAGIVFAVIACSIFLV